MNAAERQEWAIKALENPAVRAALDALENDAIANWSASDLPDREKREIAYFQLLGLKQVRAQLEIWSRETIRKGDK